MLKDVASPIHDRGGACFSPTAVTNAIGGGQESQPGNLEELFQTLFGPPDVPSCSDLSTKATQGGGSRAGQAGALLSSLTQGYKTCSRSFPVTQGELGAEAGFEPGALPADTPSTLTLLTLTVFQRAESCKS